ncbi:unnamed protein product [Ilex paraguariensis]|uniref:GDSL esterase/lipase n=1 Tax=Ilex paraguariensis TaxID=185542 RepID=A0ABC8T8V4_9AQUA
MSSPSAISTMFLVALVFMGTVAPPPQAEAARAFFVFGDSLVDNGNNNYLATTARADRPPYGIDYPTRRPTGRFSNGFNIPDLISQRLGAESALPYLSPQLTGQKLLVGANFASAGIGILNDTGFQFANIIRIAQQLQLFEQYQKRLSAVIGKDKAKQLVNKALILITLGGNDFVNNYFLAPVTARRLQFTIPAYCRYLISEYRKVLKSTVYRSGHIVTMSSPSAISTMFLVALVFMGTVAPPPQAEAARAFFVFGDSLVDNGNNNYLATTARADRPPYGIDYPTRRPTGRFSNGFNIPDLISQRLGAESALPYLSPQLTGQKLLVLNSKR